MIWFVLCIYLIVGGYFIAVVILCNCLRFNIEMVFNLCFKFMNSVYATIVYIGSDIGNNNKCAGYM